VGEEEVNGYLVPVRDPAALAAAVSRLVADADARARFGAESRRRAVARFDLSVIAGRIRSIYRDLLTGQRGVACPSPAVRHPSSPRLTETATAGAGP
jgi:glycosyltransferase involved in cell wall biosynthesis